MTNTGEPVTSLNTHSNCNRLKIVQIICTGHLEASISSEYFLMFIIRGILKVIQGNKCQMRHYVNKLNIFTCLVLYGEMVLNQVKSEIYKTNGRAGERTESNIITFESKENLIYFAPLLIDQTALCNLLFRQTSEDVTQPQTVKETVLNHAVIL